MSRLRKGVLVFWLLLWPLAAALTWEPVRDGPTRLLLVATAAALWAGAGFLLRRHRWPRAACAAIPLAAGGFFLLPARAPEPASLRQAYVAALRSYIGTPFVWGGETRRGVDCSGLVRVALVDALRRQGIATANAGLFRAALLLWWRDSTAAGLRDGCDGRTQPFLTAPSINALDPSRLLPGDLAVTANGAHVLAYLGDRTWIEADPNARVGDRVILVRTPSADNAWFSVPVHVVRWRWLQDS